MQVPARTVVIERCRSCGVGGLESLLDLGVTPLADRLLTTEQLSAPEPVAPLTLLRCPSCSLVQIAETVDPRQLFCEDYPYYSSVSPSLMAHFGESARRLISELHLDGDSLVVEAASNDGYMLRHFKSAGVPVLGIDPASGPVEVARSRGIETLEEFFSVDLASRLRADYGPADLFLANNVLAHVPDLTGFVEGIARLLRDRGTAVIEVPYLRDLMAKCEFDTIYHQHLCYFSVSALKRLFEPQGLFLNRVDQTSVHGGSLRLFLGQEALPDGSAEAAIEAEKQAGMLEVDYYQSFAERVRTLRERLRHLLDDLKASGKRIAGYGAAAKANTLISYCGIEASDLPFIVDLNERKWGKHMGGVHIPISSPDRLISERPDYLLILAWNFADEIMAQQSAFKDRGGRFIVPIPEPKII